MKIQNPNFIFLTGTQMDEQTNEWTEDKPKATPSADQVWSLSSRYYLDYKISFWPFKRVITPQREIVQTKKTCHLFLDEESCYEY